MCLQTLNNPEPNLIYTLRSKKDKPIVNSVAFHTFHVFFFIDTIYAEFIMSMFLHFFQSKVTMVSMCKLSYLRCVYYHPIHAEFMMSMFSTTPHPLFKSYNCVIVW